MPTAEETREALLDLFVGAIRGRDGQPDRYAAPRMPGGYSDQPAAGQHGGTWIEARALAGFYSQLFNDLSAAGKPPSQAMVDDANAELEEHGWSVEQNESQVWEAVDLSDEQHEHDGPVQHKRVAKDTPGAKRRVFGGAGPLGGKEYWVSADTPEPRVKAEERKKKYDTAKTPDAAALRQRAAALKAGHENEAQDLEAPELSSTGKKRANNALGAIKRTYGAHTLHRLDEMVGWVEEALGAAKQIPGGDYRDMVVRRLLGHLSRIHAMTEAAGGASAEKPDLSGSGEKTPAPEAAETPEKPAETAPPAAKEGGAGKPTYPKDWGVMIPSYVSPEGKAKVVALLKAAEGASGATVKDMIADREAMTDARHGRSERTHAELNGLYTIKQAREKAGAWNDEPWPEAHAEPLDVSEETAPQPEAPPAKEETPAPTPVAEPSQRPAPAAQAPPAQDRQASVADAILDAAREGGASEVIVVQKVRDKIPDATIEEIRAAGRQLHKDGKVQIKGGGALLPGQDMPKATTKPVGTNPEDMRRLQEREKGLLKTRPGEEEGFPRPQSITDREKRTENPQNMSLATWRARHGYDRKSPAGKATIDQQHKSAVQEALALGEKPFAAKEYPDLKAAPKGVAPDVEHPPEIAGMAPGAIKAGAKAEQLVGKGHKALGDKGRGALHALQGMLGLVGAGPDGKVKGAPPPASVEEAEKALAGLDLAGLPPEEIRQVAKGLQIPGAQSLSPDKLAGAIRAKVLAGAAAREASSPADEVNAEIAARRKAVAETPPGQKPPNTVKPPRAKKAPPLPSGHSQWEESMRGKGAGEDDLATVREDLASGDPDQAARGRRLMQELEKDLAPEPEAVPAEEEETSGLSADAAARAATPAGRAKAADDAIARVAGEIAKGGHGSRHDPFGGSVFVRVHQIRRALEKEGITDPEAQNEAILDATHRNPDNKGRYTLQPYDYGTADDEKEAIPGYGGRMLSTVEVRQPEEHAAPATEGEQEKVLAGAAAREASSPADEVNAEIAARRKAVAETPPGQQPPNTVKPPRAKKTPAPAPAAPAEAEKEAANPPPSNHYREPMPAQAQAATAAKDATGRPLTVYTGHRTPLEGPLRSTPGRQTDEEKKSGAGGDRGLYFSEHEGTAGNYAEPAAGGGVLAAHLDVRNPLDLTKRPDDATLDRLLGEFRKHPELHAAAAAVEKTRKNPDASPYQWFDAVVGGPAGNEVFRQAMHALGYDAIRHEDYDAPVEHPGGETRYATNWLVFDPARVYAAETPAPPEAETAPAEAVNAGIAGRAAGMEATPPGEKLPTGAVESTETAAPDLKNLADHYRQSTGWERSGSDRLRVFDGMMNSNRPPDAGGLIDALNGYARGRHLEHPLGKAMDAAGRQLLERVDDAGAKEILKSYESDLRDPEQRAQIPPAVRDFLKDRMGGEYAYASDHGDSTVGELLGQGKEPPPPEAAKPALEPATEDNVPPYRRSRIQSAIAKIKDFNEELQRMKDLEQKGGGHGRYQSELRGKRKKELEEAAKLIEETRATAESKGIDLQPLLDQMGYAPPSPPHPDEEGWAPEEEVKAKIADTHKQLEEVPPDGKLAAPATEQVAPEGSPPPGKGKHGEAPPPGEPPTPEFILRIAMGEVPVYRPTQNVYRWRDGDKSQKFVLENINHPKGTEIYYRQEDGSYAPLHVGKLPSPVDLKAATEGRGIWKQAFKNLRGEAETPEQVAADEKDAYTGEDKSGALPGENDHAGDSHETDGEHERELLEGQGEAGSPGGLPGEEPVGARPETAPGAVLPGPAEGTPGERGGERLPDRQDELGAGTDALPDGAGGGAGGRPAGGQGEAAADSAGGTGPADGVGEPERGGLGGGGGRADTPGEESVASRPEEDNPTDVAGDNFRYDDPRALAKRGMTEKLQDNFAALRVLRNIEGEGRDTATPAEQAALAKFVGWGQFKALFNTYDSPDWDTLTPEAQQELLAEQQKYGKEKRMLEEFLGGTDSPEYLSARRSVLNAHYTHPDIVDAHWKIAERLGYKGGKFLETSAGIGYYLGMMPAHLAGKTRSSAVELDKITGRMAGLLYPKANVENKGFQHFKTNDNYFDLVASNVPFGAYGVSDPRYNKHGANIHDYFFLKSMDAVRPGGLVMHITSTGTLDKQDPAIRKELASKGDLVGAIRFPGGAHKENAGTDVVTDLLIFKKRAPGEAPSGDQSWLETTTVPDPAGGEPIPVNKYFADHPEQVLGTLERTGKMYKGQSVNVSRTDDYEERLAAAIDRLPRDVMTRQAAPARRFSPKNAPKPGDTREGGFQVAEGKVYVRDGQEMVEQPVNAKTAARIEGILQVRDAVRAVINDQLDRRDATASRALLNKAYDAFVAKHGFLHSKENVSAFSTDPDYPMMMGLEHWDAKAKKATKSDRFHKDTIRTGVEVTHAGSVGDALRVSLHQRGSVDVDHMAKLTGHTPEEVGKHLVEKGLAYHDPSTGWQHSDQYLSGNVRRKLALAKAAAANDPQYQANVKALEKVQPEDVHHDQIEARLGAGWVPPADVREFAAHLLDMRAGGADQFDVKYSPRTGTWFMGWNEQSHGWERSKKSKQATQVWSAGGEAFKDLFEAALNNKKVKVYQDGPGNTRIIDPKATEDANAKIGEMKDAFKEWVWEDDSRRERLHRYYNDNFNNIRHMKYDGSHQTFPGMNPAVELRDHQKNFVWQVVTTGRGLAAHEVGTGKTYSMIAAAMELRRLGLAKKPCICALKANIEDITANCLKLYPGAKILSTVDMFDGPNRKQAIARMASGDYDIVLMTHDHIGMLPMRPEVTEKYINNQIKELVAAKKEALKAEGEEEGPEGAAGAGRRGKKSKGGKQGNRVVAQIQKAIESLQKKLEDHLVASKKDDALTFEETGIDTLFVDECFPGETMIVTEEGLMPIGEIVENRLPLRVLSCNRDTHELEYKPVSSWFKRPLKNHLVRVTHEQGSFVCTPNHEVWTEEDGYVQAGLLESRHTLRCVPEGFRGQCIAGAGGEGEVLQSGVRRPWAVVARDQAVQAVRQGLHATGEGWRRSESVLLADLRQETSVGESGEEAETQGCHAGGDHRGNPQGVVAADDGEQPDGRSGGSREGSAETAWQNLLEQGRQWPVDRSAEIAGIFPVLADGVQHCHSGGEGSLRMPAQRLQGGSGAPDAEDRGGDRRPDAQDAQVEVSRQAEDGGSVRSGVVRVALHQRAGEQRTFAGGVGDSCVYDLEVEGNHNYFADGVNVSNCHKFKSLPVVTRHREIKGVPTQESDRAALMHMRTQWLLEQNNGRGVVFATGTPVANTMAELYNLQRYLQPEELKERGIENFDAWCSAFAEVATKQEFTVTGDYKSVSRMAGFVNIPEMQGITRQIMDVQRADDMVDAEGKSTIIRPRRKDHVVQAPFTPAMEALMQSLKERAKALKKSWQPGKGEDNMLAICNDGRKGALDMRLLDASAPDDPTSKVNQCLVRVQEIRKKAPDAAQLIFLDAGVNPTDDGFHLYGDIINKLVDSGIPRERIADFSKLEGKKKEQAQEEMREGKILIGIGSTDKLGTGVNVQDKLAALHHLDTPRDYTPAGVEQRDGRGWRQGNQNMIDPETGKARPGLQDHIAIHRYISEKSLDAFMWQLMSSKDKMIKQVITQDIDKNLRHAREEDVEELSYDQLMAIATGNPQVLEKVNLEDEVKQLTSARNRHEREQIKFKDTAAAVERNLPHLEKRAQALHADAAFLDKTPGFHMVVGGVEYTDREKARDAVKKHLEDNKDALAEVKPWRPFLVGVYRGVPIQIESNSGYMKLMVPGGGSYEASTSMRAIEHVAGNIARHAAEADHDVAQAKEDVVKLRKNIGKTFAKGSELEAKRARVKEIEAELAALSKQEENAPTPAGQPEAARAAAPAAKGEEWSSGNLAAQTVRAPKPESLWKGVLGGKLANYHATAQEGYLTDGRVAVAIGEAEKKGLPPADPMAKSYKPMIEEWLAAPGAPARMVASRKTDGNIHRLFQDDAGNRVAVNARYLALIEKLHPGATYRMPAKEGRPLIAEKDGKPVGMVMPVLDAEVERWTPEGPIQHRRTRLARCYARLSRQAMLRGDRASARIYAKAARETSAN